MSRDYIAEELQAERWPMKTLTPSRKTHICGKRGLSLCGIKMRWQIPVNAPPMCKRCLRACAKPDDEITLSFANADSAEIATLRKGRTMILINGNNILDIPVRSHYSCRWRDRLALFVCLLWLGGYAAVGAGAAGPSAHTVMDSATLHKSGKARVEKRAELCLVRIPEDIFVIDHADYHIKGIAIPYCVDQLRGQWLGWLRAKGRFPLWDGNANISGRQGPCDCLSNRFVPIVDTWGYSGSETNPYAHRRRTSVVVYLDRSSFSGYGRPIGTVEGIPFECYPRALGASEIVVRLIPLGDGKAAIYYRSDNPEYLSAGLPPLESKSFWLLLGGCLLMYVSGVQMAENRGTWASFVAFVIGIAAVGCGSFLLFIA